MTLTAPARAGGRPAMGYSAALDGIRAFAVVAVLLYHGDFPAFPGGFLGVEVFFVISGYLITALIDQEVARTGRLDLRGFWVRRFRRLLPAAWAMILVFGLVMVIAYREEAARYASAVPAGLLYVANWWFIFAEESYFEAAGRPPLLRHLWSLAIEEQFYLILPVALMLVRNRVSRSRRAIGAVVIALASAIAMAVMFDPTTDPSRVYFGTDTRASGLLLGVALGSVYRPWLWRSGSRRAPGVDVLGAIGLVGLTVLVVRANDYAPFVYRGGFVLVDLLTLAVVLAAMHPGSLLRRPLGWEPIRQVGLRSYSLYLWHWPVFALLRPGIDVPWGTMPTFLVRMAITVVLAEASYRFLETPIRDGRAMAWLREQRHLGGGLLGWSRPLTTMVAVGVSAVIVVGVGLASSPETEQVLMEDVAAEVLGPESTTATAPTGEAAGPDTTEPTTTTVAPDAEGPGAPAAPGSTVVDTVDTRAYFVGDSVLHGVRQALSDRMPNATVNTEIGRQPRVAMDVASTLKSQGALPGNYVVFLGANGVVDERLIRRLSETVGSDRLVLVTAHTVKRWGAESTDNIRSLQGELGYRVIDWGRLAQQHPEWFRTDGTHPTAAGQQALVDLLADSLRG